MTRGTRLFVSLLIGTLVPTLAVASAARAPDKPAWTQVVLSPGQWVASLAGPMPVVGQGASGRPIEEPTAVHHAFAIGGMLLTIAIYALLTWLILLLASRVTARRVGAGAVE